MRLSAFAYGFSGVLLFSINLNVSGHAMKYIFPEITLTKNYFSLNSERAPIRNTTAVLNSSQNYSFKHYSKYNVKTFWPLTSILKNEMIMQVASIIPFWKERWFKGLLVVIGLSGIYLVYHIRLRQVKHHERLKTEFAQKLAYIEMKVLKAHMNPHFIFNSLNAINWYIIKSEAEKASLYLTKFSKLIRIILDNSNHKTISLHQELIALKLYLEMEALRFNEKFTYSISVDKELNDHSIGVPPMIIQPFVENTIWQLLLNKEAEGKIEIQVNRMNGGLRYVITDNGIGRKKATEMTSKAADEDKAFGMKVNEDRLAILNRESNITSVETIDLKNRQGNPQGTQVIIKILSAELEPEF